MIENRSNPVRRLDSAFLQSDLALHNDAAALAADPVFVNAWQKLDLASLTREFKAFGERISGYNTFHNRERRLWSLRLGGRSVATELEEQLKAAVPTATETSTTAFASMKTCMTLLKNAGFGAIMASQEQRADFVR